MKEMIMIKKQLDEMVEESKEEIRDEIMRDRAHERKEKIEKTCWCGRPAYAKKLCRRHYQQNRRRLRETKSLRRIRRRFSTAH